jgi:hypothetical protein
MPPTHAKHVILDFTGIGADIAGKVLGNLSAAAVAGEYLWTASDELRSLQCFERVGDRFVLKQSVNLDDAIKQAIPRPPKELDLESLDFDGKHLWFCGSHCRSREKVKPGEPLDPEIKSGLNRHILGRIPLARDGSWSGKKGEALSFAGEGALRKLLRKDPFIAPFLDIPSKENGLDIEGMTIVDGRVLLGLRGPVVGGRAAILELEINTTFRLTKVSTRFIDLGSLGIRDLHWDGRRLLILAGPTFLADEPFRILAMSKSGRLLDLDAKQLLPSGLDDHPEAITALKQNGRRGLLMLADGESRIQGLRYTADWYPL